MDYPGQDIFHAFITVLSDNHQPSAMNFALATEGLSDRTTYLANRGCRGTYRQNSVTVSALGEITGAVGGTGGWVAFDAANGLVPYLDVPSLNVGDVVWVGMSGAFIQSGNATHAEVKMYATQGHGSPGALIPAAVPGMHTRVDASVGGAVPIPLPAAMVGSLVMSVAGTCRFRLYGRNPSSQVPEPNNYRVGVKDNGYPLSIVAVVLRPTSTWGDA